MADAVNRATLLAFLGIVLLGGINGTAIKFANQELGPFWSATLRFALAAAIFFGIVFVRRVPLPRGRRLVGNILYGLLGFGVTFALVNWSLVFVPVGVGQIIIALVPLLTLLLAVSQGQERFRPQSLAGGIVAIAGVGLVFAEQLGTSIPILPALAILAAALAVALSNVIVKSFPPTDPTAKNAVAMSSGAVLLFVLSVAFGDPLVVPSQPDTWLALGYLVIVGSVIVFTLFLYVIVRWTASATSYALLLMPLVAVAVAAVALGEQITPFMVIGGLVVLAGVYLGAFAPSIERPLPGLFRRAPRRAGALTGPPALQNPNCP
jgi:drug/metabolite transporter (DMT)-like permease